MKHKTVKIATWALCDKRSISPLAVGNGYEFQLCMFLTRKEAREFRGRHYWAATYPIRKIQMAIQRHPTPKGK